MYAEKEERMHPEKDLSRVQSSFMSSGLVVLVPPLKKVEILGLEQEF